MSCAEQEETQVPWLEHMLATYKCVMHENRAGHQFMQGGKQVWSKKGNGMKLKLEEKETEEFSEEGLSECTRFFLLHLEADATWY